MLKLKVSGSIRSNGNIIDYSDLELIMPECDQGWVQSHAVNRIFPDAAETKLKTRVDSVVTMYIDGQEKIDKQIVQVEVPTKQKQEVEEDTGSGAV